jgi:hypothetical protein
MIVVAMMWCSTRVLPGTISVARSQTSFVFGASTVT